MNIHEFETLTGLSVSDEEYAKIEKIYLNAGELDKESFCKGWKQAKDSSREVMEAISDNVEGKRIHINRLDKKIEALEVDLDREREIKELRVAELEEADARIKGLEAERDRLSSEKIKLVLALLNAGLDAQAIEILGHAAIIGLKCGAGMELTEADKNFLAETFKD